MSQLTPFEGARLPAYLQDAEDTNNDLLSHASTSYPIISIKGKVFTVNRSGERDIIPNPLDPETPANRIDMVLVKANKDTSKVFYAKGYTEGSDDKPDCWSNDGVRPDPTVEKPVNPVCASCPKNQWGSKVNENGKKIKACSDSVRIAIATPGQINDPYFLRVPAASIKNLGEFGKQLSKRRVPYQAVLTEISFDKESATPLLLFKPKAFLTPEQFEQVKKIAAGDIVQAIMGSNYMEDQDGTAPAADPAPEQKPAATKPAQKPAPTKPAATKPVQKAKPQVTEEEVEQAVDAGDIEVNLDEIDIDGISFE